MCETGGEYVLEYYNISRKLKLCLSINESIGDIKKYRFDLYISIQLKYNVAYTCNNGVT